MRGASSPETETLLDEIRRLSLEKEQLKNFIEIGKSIHLERDVNQLVPCVMAKISKTLQAERSSLFLLDSDRMELTSKFAEKLEIDRINIELKMGLVGCCVLARKLVNVTNASEDPRINLEIEKVAGLRTESVLCAPVYGSDGQVMGAVELLNKNTGVFTGEDEKAVQETAAVISGLSSDSDLDRDATRALLKTLRHTTGSEHSHLLLLDRENGKLDSFVSDGPGESQGQVSLHLGIAGLVAITGQELNITDAYTDPRFDRRTDERTGFITRCLLCVPIKNQAGEVLGVIEAINKKDGVFTESDMDVLKALSSMVAISIENALLFAGHHRQFRSVLEVLAASIDAKDTLTAGHSQKVTEYSVAIARELGFDKSDIDVLSVAALLHDYGKLGTDDQILKKPGRLTEEEYEHIKQHVVNTRNILKKMNFTKKYRRVPLIASAHHERLDGSGYSDGLQGHEIPFMSKIIAVADVFEALTADRHYRKAFTVEEAFAILEEGAGTQYDPHVIQALKRYCTKQSQK